MRTTVNIDNELLTQARQRAAREGRTVSAFIEDALRSYLAKVKARAAPSRREPVITFRGNGLRPGVTLESASELLDTMDGIA